MLLGSKSCRAVATAWVLVALLGIAAGRSAGADDAPLLAPLSDGASVELPPLAAGLPSPAAALGYPLGSRFTHHHRILGYLETLAAASPRATLWQYGTTYEERPLVLLAVSSPANIERLEELKRDRARLADPTGLGAEALDALVGSSPVVVWLAYGVHGNESSSSEAAMAAAYLLAAAEGDWPALLEEAVVIIDPVSNPDGRERYVHFYDSRRGRLADPFADAAEHRESWPGGRQNHYLIDLNRDWAWATQRETRARLAAYRAWEPQVYVDFHEMSSDSTYFFPPAAEPVHPQIASGPGRWQEVFGKANAAAFDRHGWMYYAAERFDLFYPGYGDSYPGLRGAVGMTYEVAGHARAGEVLRLEDGTLLALADRVARHLTTSLATVRTAIAHRRALVAEFAAGRLRAAGDGATTYLWPPGRGEGRFAAELLSEHGIEVVRLAAPAELEVRPHGGGALERRRFAAGTLAATTAQPLGSLVRALLDLQAPMPAEFLARQRQRIDENQEAEFFDITAWALPLALGLDAWEMRGPPPPGALPAAADPAGLEGSGSVGYLLPPQGLRGYRLAAALQRQGLRYRLALSEFTNGGRRYPGGTLFIPSRGNPPELEAALAELAEECGVRLVRIATASSESGSSLGSESVPPMRPARIGLLSGSGVSPTSLGALWHLLDRELEVPHHLLDVAALGEVDLGELDVLIFPDGGGYDRAVDDAAAAELERWVEAGGTLVAIRRAVRWLAKRELSAVKTRGPEGADEEEDDGGGEMTPERRALSTPGAALVTAVRGEHPLAAGLAAPPSVLFLGADILEPSGNPRRDVLTVRQDGPVAAGFAWPEAREKLSGALLVGTEARGKGTLVLFAQEPVFRLFWRAPTPLFLNAILHGPSLGDRMR